MRLRNVTADEKRIASALAEKINPRGKIVWLRSGNEPEFLASFMYKEEKDSKDYTKFDTSNLHDPYEGIRDKNADKFELITDGKLLNNTLVVKAYASVPGSIVIDGFVNKIVV